MNEMGEKNTVSFTQVVKWWRVFAHATNGQNFYNIFWLILFLEWMRWVDELMSATLFIHYLHRLTDGGEYMRMDHFYEWINEHAKFGV